jgi:uncharacterized protein (UPF0276 family)
MRALQGAGLGFRREMVSDLRHLPAVDVDFFEVAPENWLDIGGQYANDLRFFSEKYPFVCHGLSLSLGGTEPLDIELLKKIKAFIKMHNVVFYTEHLSWCTDDGHLYDLLPIPFTEQAIQWVVSRIQKTQDLLGMQIGIENASYYINPPNGEMTEEAFISEIVKRSGCFLHLDVNNIYVNSQNFKFDPYHYMNALPLQQVGYIHVAGHYTEPDGLIIDTHGAEVIDPVWALLKYSYSSIPYAKMPTCLERDFNYPGIKTLMTEVDMIRQLQQKAAAQQRGGEYECAKRA